MESDLFGDLGKLRHAIVHNEGIATKKVGGARVLTWFLDGEVIFLTSSHVDNLYHDIDSYITELCGIPKDYVPARLKAISDEPDVQQK